MSFIKLELNVHSKNGMQEFHVRTSKGGLIWHPIQHNVATELIATEPIATEPVLELPSVGEYFEDLFLPAISENPDYEYDTCFLGETNPNIYDQ